MDDEVSVPGACTLPTAERPLRLAEFDDLFATALRGQQRLSPTRLRLRLDPVAEQAARDLAVRESLAGFVLPGQRVVVGQGDHVEARGPSAAHHLRGRVGAVRRRGVGVKVYAHDGSSYGAASTVAGAARDQFES